MLTRSRSADGACALLLALSVLTLRILGIGQAPFTDEGNYIAFAWYPWIHPWSPLPYACANSNVNLYPTLLAWLFAMGGNPVLPFRAADAILMACCGIVFFALLRQLANRAVALGACLVWLLAFNHPLFTNAGFKNPYAPGFLCILLAAYLSTCDAAPRRAAVAGALLGITFLLREPLIVFAAPVLILLVRKGDRRAAVWFVLACVTTIVLGIGGLGIVRGGRPLDNAHAVLEGWFRLSRMYRTLVQVDTIHLAAHRRMEILSTFDVVAWAVPFWLAGFAVCGRLLRRCPALRTSIGVALLAVLVPLPEFFLKLGFFYHLSAAFFGLSALAAIAFQHLCAARKGLAVVIASLVLVAGFLVPATTGGTSALRWWSGVRHAHDVSRRFWPVIVRDDCSDPAVQDSFYLDAASRIRQHSDADDRIMVSGFYAVLYPLAQRAPADLGVADLSTFVMSRDLRLSQGDRDRIQRARPVLFVETNRFPSMNLRGCFNRFDEVYREVDHVDTGKRHYGHYGCRIWKRRDTQESAE